MRRLVGPASFGKAVALQLLGRFDEAAGAYEVSLESEPNSPETLANLIAMSAERRDLEHMREYSQKLLSIAPQSAVALQGLATVALERRDNHQAAKYCDRIVEVAPDVWKAGTICGIALAPNSFRIHCIEACGFDHGGDINGPFARSSWN